MLTQNLNLKSNLKYSSKNHLKRCIPLQQAGLSFEEYQLLVKDNILPSIGSYTKDQCLLLSETVWLAMIRELESCNFSRSVIQGFARTLMMEVALVNPGKNNNCELTADVAF